MAHNRERAEGFADIHATQHGGAPRGVVSRPAAEVVSRMSSNFVALVGICLILTMKWKRRFAFSENSQIAGSRATPPEGDHLGPGKVARASNATKFATVSALAYDRPASERGLPVRIVAALALLVAYFAQLSVSAADPLSDLTDQLTASGRPLTQGEWCQLALLAMASRYANEQTRMALNEMSRNRGCYQAPQPQAQPSLDEQARVAVCRTVPDLLFEPGITKAQKLQVMKIAKANGCIK